MKLAAWIGGGVMLAASVTMAQTLRFDEYRERQVPDYANVRIGPFYSDVVFSQSAGYRYTKTSGTGRDYLYQEGLGRIVKDGSDFPLITQLSFRNYMIISKNVDIDISFSLGYRYFPMETEENDFLFDVAGPLLVARKDFQGEGGTTLSLSAAFPGQSGATASLSSDFQLTPFVRGRFYDFPSYRTDYIDEQGYSDDVSGQKYTSFQNVAGVDTDWLMAKDKNLAYSGSRADTLPQGSSFDLQRSVVYNQELAYQQQFNPVASGGVRGKYIWRNYEKGRGDEFQRDYTAFMGADLSDDTRLQTTLGYSMGELSGANQYESNGVSDTVIGSIRLQSQLTENLSHVAGYGRSQRGGFSSGFEVADEYSYGVSWVSQDWSFGILTAYKVVKPRLYETSAYTSDYTDWLNRFTMARPLSPDLTLTFGTEYAIRDSKQTLVGDTGEADPIVGSSYDTWTSNIGLAYVLARHLTANAYVEHMERFSDVEDLALSRNMAGVTLTYRRDL